MAVGQRVSAFHPKVRQLHTGTVLTPDGDHYKIQFDSAPLGVLLVRFKLYHVVLAYIWCNSRLFLCNMNLRWPHLSATTGWDRCWSRMRLIAGDQA